LARTFVIVQLAGLEDFRCLYHILQHAMRQPSISARW